MSHLKMNQINCPRLVRDTVYILIMEGKVGNMSNNLGFREHVTILKRKLFALFSSSCLSSVTHEALTLPGKHVIRDVSTIHHPIAFKRHQARVSALGVGKHKTPSPHLIILWVICMTVCLQTWFSLLSSMPTTNRAPPHFFSCEQKGLRTGGECEQRSQ